MKVLYQSFFKYNINNNKILLIDINLNLFQNDLILIYFFIQLRFIRKAN